MLDAVLRDVHFEGKVRYGTNNYWNEYNCMTFTSVKLVAFTFCVWPQISAVSANTLIWLCHLLTYSLNHK